jgi:hypothetical protein
MLYPSQGLPFTVLFCDSRDGVGVGALGTLSNENSLNVGNVRKSLVLLPWRPRRL